jgi:hypothetical protein
MTQALLFLCCLALSDIIHTAEVLTVCCIFLCQFYLHQEFGKYAFLKNGLQ